MSPRRPRPDRPSRGLRVKRPRTESTNLEPAPAPPPFDAPASELLAARGIGSAGEWLLRPTNLIRKTKKLPWGEEESDSQLLSGMTAPHGFPGDPAEPSAEFTAAAERRQAAAGQAHGCRGPPEKKPTRPFSGANRLGSGRIRRLAVVGTQARELRPERQFPEESAIWGLNRAVSALR